MMSVKILMLAAILHLGRCKPVSGFALQYQVGQTYHYAYTTETLLSEATPSSATSTQKDVGFRFSATIAMTPLWAGGQQLLVQLAITKPKLHSVARPEVTRDLKALPRLPVFFQWDAGKVGRVFASEEDSTLAINIKKGIVSMFQLKLDAGDHEELDASGECQVTYEKQGNIIKRIKSRCQNTETTGQHFTVQPLMSVTKESRSQTTYHISDDLIQSAVAAEEHVIRSNFEQSTATRVNMKQELKITNTSKGKKIQATNLEDGIKKISKSQKLELYGMVLGTSFEATPCSAENFSLGNKVNELRQKMDPSKMASSDATSSFLELVSIFRSSSKERLLDLLKDKQNEDIIGSLIDVMAAAQTSASQRALMEYLKFDDYYYIDKPERYLLAVAFSTHPNEALLQDLVSLYKKDIPNEKLHESMGEALGAVLYSYCRVGDQCQSKIVKEILKMFLDRLESCEKLDCKPMVIRALTNAGIPDTIPTLLNYAETSKDNKVSEASIKALRRMGKENMNNEVKNCMRRIFLQNNRGYDSAVRSQALKIILENGPTQEDIKNIMLETTDPYNTDYDMFVQNRLFNLMEKDDQIRTMVKEVLKDTNISNWHILAPKGKALAFTSNMAETSSFTSTYFMYTENSRSGILKRSGMDVDVLSAGQSLPVYNFGMYAAGMEGLLGEEVEDGQEDASATAGMSLDLIDVSLRPVSFFTGQSGLMSAVWNAPSELTSAFQTTILLTDHLERLHLQNGLIVEQQFLAAFSVDLSGSLAVSLWNKNAKSLVQSSGAVMLRGSSNIRTAPFNAGIDLTTESASVINFQTDVDFYDGVKMCLQMSRPQFVVKQNVTRVERARGFPKRYLARTLRSRKINALSYPLPRPNSKQCRALLGGS